MSPVSPQQRQQVAQLLGREPRGLEGVAVARDSGQPMVIRVCSLVDDKPFPTLFWLVDPDLAYRIDTLEAAGLIRDFQARVDADAVLQQRLRSDHLAHIALRNSHMSQAVESTLRRLGYYAVLQARGVGGIQDFTRIRCLHTWYAAHLVVPNSIGAMLDEHFAAA